MEENQLYLDFFTKVLQRILSKDPKFTSAKARPQPYFSTGMGKGSFLIFCEFKDVNKNHWQNELRVGLFWDTKNKEKNDKILSTLKKYGSLIEQEINRGSEWIQPKFTLIWSKSARRERKIYISVRGSIFYSPPEKVEYLTDFATTYLRRFKQFFSSFLKELDDLANGISTIIDNKGELIELKIKK